MRLEEMLLEALALEAKAQKLPEGAEKAAALKQAAKLRREYEIEAELEYGGP